MKFDTPEELLRGGKEIITIPNKYVAWGFLGIVLLISVVSSFYSVGPDEVGVIRRFGKYKAATNPGLHWKLPFGIDKLNLVKVTYVYKEEFGFRTLVPGVNTRYSPAKNLDESLMLTGDLNVLNVEWIVQFRIKDPVKFLFRIQDPRETIRDISESVMRLIVGNYSVNEVLTSQRLEINLKAQDRIQEILDNYDSGIEIVTVKLQDVNPPDAVKPSFNEVNEAKQEKEKVINQAWEAYNKAVPRARGEAEKTIRQAEGYALRRVNIAQGDADKFIETWNAYKEAKDVTRKRLYLETMGAVLPRAGRIYVVDPREKGILPLLNLEKKGE